VGWGGIYNGLNKLYKDSNLEKVAYKSVGTKSGGGMWYWPGVLKMKMSKGTQITEDKTFTTKKKQKREKKK